VLPQNQVTVGGAGLSTSTGANVGDRLRGLVPLAGVVNVDPTAAEPRGDLVDLIEQGVTRIPLRRTFAI
jgi:hypothetical protein